MRLLSASFDLLCRLLPLSRKKIVFSNFNGRGYGDNPRYIAEEILRQGLDYDLVWLVSDLNERMPEGIRKVGFYSRNAKLELSTAKVIVNNVKSLLPYTKKGSQYYIQTWHGDFPLKYIEAEVEDKLDAEYVRCSKEESKQIDLLLSGSRYMSDIYRKSFWYEGEILEKGIPRNDVFFKEHSFLDKPYRQVLYAPTFRDDFRPFPTPNFNSLIAALENLTGEKWRAVIRLHPNERDKSSRFVFSDSIIDGTSIADPQLLLIESDLLITDYSSVMYEFSLMKKPVILFAADVEQYKADGRGLRSIFDCLPFVLCKTEDELLRNLPLVLSKEYPTCFESFRREKIGSYDNGTASEAVVHRIKEVISG